MKALKNYMILLGDKYDKKVLAWYPIESRNIFTAYKKAQKLRMKKFLEFAILGIQEFEFVGEAQ